MKKRGKEEMEMADNECTLIESTWGVEHACSGAVPASPPGEAHIFHEREVAPAPAATGVEGGESTEQAPAGYTQAVTNPELAALSADEETTLFGKGTEF